jgi:cellulose synthase/poly-beta-1,6-N-acetylglucosamine synthase-like glycosyltransferase
MVKIFSWAYFFVCLLLTIYGVNALLLTLFFLYRQITGKSRKAAAVPSSIDWPEVTIQLPVYNESTVIRRLIDSAARLNYPVDRLTIQVLDDSTDDTTRQAAEQVDYWRSQGRNISLVHRPVRSEYKAGNLKNGMKLDHSEFLAIFDADFIPPVDWLKKALEPFFEPGGDVIGMVQTRWVHLNESQSPLTRAQALLLDGHFGIEQRVRSDEGLFFGFNGSAGIWRRRCIEESGGWRGEMLSEDLDLSYRAQLNGWKFRFLPDVVAPAELPPTMTAFKIQQFRWAKGSMQAVRNHVPRILRARISLWKKWHGLLHISGYIVHPLMTLLVLLSLPLALAGPQALKEVPMAWLGIGALGTPLLFPVAEWSLYPKQNWWKRALWLPLMVILGTGVAVSGTKAVLSGLLNVPSDFQRTPRQGDSPIGMRSLRAAWESIHIDLNTWIEILLAILSFLIVVIDIWYGNWINAIFLSVFSAGFAWVAASTLWETFSPWLAKRSSSRMLNARID